MIEVGIGNIFRYFGKPEFRHFQTTGMDTEMAAWWSFNKSEPFFSLTSVTLPALLAIVLMIFGGLAYVLQVKAVKTKPKLK